MVKSDLPYRVTSRWFAKVLAFPGTHVTFLNSKISISFGSVDAAKTAADTLKNEIKDAGTETFDRVKQAGVDAAEAAGQKLKTP